MSCQQLVGEKDSGLWLDRDRPFSGLIPTLLLTGGSGPKVVISRPISTFCSQRVVKFGPVIMRNRGASTETNLCVFRS